MLLSTRFEEALVFAHGLHAHQLRKGGAIPYISHLLSVAALVLEYGGDEDEAIAGLLHDAVEDQGGETTRQEIRRRFGETVVAIVDGCSDSDTSPKPPWQARKEAYLAHLRTAPPSVLLVSAADKLHNLRSLLTDYRLVHEELWQRFKTGKQGTLWYYRSLVEVYQTCYPSPLTDEVTRTFEELEALVAVSDTSKPTLR
ncbi:MAG TPA: HD domain-containing protein [Ktedonobacteraceae bacterium]|nr:HD domain-containing protein [Ktedonobacteraceae bacterium]